MTISEMGRKGGRAGRGKAKARTREQAQRAARARWAKVNDLMSASDPDRLTERQKADVMVRAHKILSK